jgi:hypothetical protein
MIAEVIPKRRAEKISAGLFHNVRWSIEAGLPTRTNATIRSPLSDDHVRVAVPICFQCLVQVIDLM